MEDYVDHAIKDNDYSEISDIIEKSVEAAIDLTRTGANAIFTGIQKSFRKDEKRIPVNRDPRLVRQKSTSPTGYFWLRNFSFIGTITMGIASIGEFIDLLRYDFFFDSILGLLVTLLLTGAGYWISRYFHQKMKLEKNFLRYRTEIGDNRVLAVEDFSTAVSLPQPIVVEELRKLISEGYFPQGRVVENGQLFLLDRGAYKAYKENYRDSNVLTKEKPREIDHDNEEFKDERQTLINQYVNTIEAQKSKVKNHEFKLKLEKLLIILHGIENAIKDDPYRIDDLNKFVDYYTPTTIKLVDRYLEFEEIQVPLESMEKSMADIEKSIQTLISAYENLLAELYKEDLLDLSAEMEVMKTILTQDGLLKPEK